MKCAGQRKCPGLVTCLASWGPPDNPQRTKELPLCDKCLDALWIEMRGLVESGQIEWQLRSLTDREKGVGL